MPAAVKGVDDAQSYVQTYFQAYFQGYFQAYFNASSLYDA